ncbi:two-pore potassium channel 3-like [Neltuma alba]|uniref:two-pore potassium channel 3-like n=1 Tax=Neltuma alba TaxID=207710 RepID=UPI0010A48892|nr:two-pore potassium channel 3-like [Prosopis alba]XP_028754769.1 two-pore potassium channel 3-like [Prosopis alba]
MENEPLLSYYSPRKRHPPSHLAPLAENDEVVLPLNASEIKERLIFGPSTPEDSAALVEALTLSLNSPRQHSSSHDLLAALLESQSQLPRKSSSNPAVRRCKTAPAMAVIPEFNHQQSSEPKPQRNSNSIVSQAVILLVIYLSLGVVIYSLNRHNFTGSETNPVVDALYYCVVTMCTIGYGDITPTSTATKLFSILFSLVGFGFIDILLCGMVIHVLDLQESHLLKTMKRSYVIDAKKGRMRIRMKVALALLVVVLCIGVGVCVMHYVEKLTWVDSFYLSVMSVTTVGYGDQAFKSFSGRIFAAIWLLLSTLAVARAFLYLAEARVDKRNRRMAKWILGHDLTVSDFFAADLDNNGCVSKSEFVIYKLKEMGKLADKDIMLVGEKFDRLDTGKRGYIKLADLMEANL